MKAKLINFYTGLEAVLGRFRGQTFRVDLNKYMTQATKSLRKFQFIVFCTLGMRSEAMPAASIRQVEAKRRTKYVPGALAGVTRPMTTCMEDSNSQSFP